MFGGCKTCDLSRTFVFKTNLFDFYTSEVSILKSFQAFSFHSDGEEKLSVAASFFDNLFFPLPSDIFLDNYINSDEKKELLADLKRPKSELIGIPSYKAFHIFDRSNRTWITSETSLGFRN